MFRNKSMWIFLPLLLLIGWIGTTKVGNANDRLQLIGLRAKAEAAFQENRYEDAAFYFGELFQKAEIIEESIEGGIGWCRALVSLRRYDDAWKILDKVTLRFPSIKNANSKKEAQAKVHYWRGMILFSKGELSKAISFFELASKSTDPELHALSFYQMGVSYVRLAQIENAVQLFRKLRTDYPQNSIAYLTGCIGELEILIITKQWDEFDQLYNEWKSKFQDEWYVKTKFLFLKRLILGGKYKEALAEYTQSFLDVSLLELPVSQRNHLQNNDYFELLRLLGQKLVELHEYSLAREFYVKLQPRLVYDSQNQSLLLDMAIAAYQAMIYFSNYNQPEKSLFWYQMAIDDFTHFTNIYPKTPETTRVHYYLGLLYYHRGQEQEAIKMWTDTYGHPLAPDDVRFDVAMELAKYYRRKEETQKAIEWYLSAGGISVAPNLRADAWFARGELLAQIGRYTEAAGVFEGILSFAPEYPKIIEALYNQANCKYLAGDYLGAVQGYRQCLSRLGSSHTLRPQTMYYCAMALSKTERWEEAQNLFFELAKNYPDSPLAPDALLGAAENARNTGAFRNLITFLNTIIQQYKESPQYYRALYERLYYHLNIQNNIQNALNDYELFFSQSSKVYKDYPRYSAQILMWLGNYYVLKRDYLQAINFFQKVGTDLPEVPEASEAWYEAAKAAYNHQIMNETNDFSLALQFLNQLEKIPQTQPQHARVFAQAYLLRGDILSLLAQYKEAATMFEQCRNLAQGISLRLYFRATGRLGDMMYVQAGTTTNPEEREKKLSLALSYYQQVVNAATFDYAMYQKALYHCGLVYQMMGNTPMAVRCFRDVFESYFIQYQEERVPVDWFYFLKAGMELIQYYKDNDQPWAAIWIYERITQAKIPTFSSWAQIHLDQLKKSITAHMDPEAEKLLNLIFQCDIRQPESISTALKAVEDLKQLYPDIAKRWELPINEMIKLFDSLQKKSTGTNAPNRK